MLTRKPKPFWHGNLVGRLNMKLNCELKNVSCIYRIDFPNGRFYIGKTVNLKRRIDEHIRDSIKSDRTEYHTKVGAHIRKYSEDMVLSIVEYVEPELLDEREKYYIKLFDAINLGCNLTEGGDGSSYGENSVVAVFTNDEVYDIRKRRFEGERKIDVYQDYTHVKFDSFENVWLGNGYPGVGQEFIIAPNSKTRQEYSSNANRGSRNNKAKLTEQDVLAIRELAKTKTLDEIHDMYSFVSRETIRKVVYRYT